MVVCEHGRPPTYVDPYRLLLICAEEMTRRRIVGDIDDLVPVEEAKRYDYSTDLFCRAPGCLNAPGPDGVCGEHARPDPPDLPPLLEWIEPDTAARVPADAHFATQSCEVNVFATYNQVHLTDSKPPLLGPDMRRGGVGLIRSRPGFAILMIGTHTGHIPFTITVANRDPGADVDGYEDIVETDFLVRTPDLLLVGGGIVQYPLPSVPVGPGMYRMRYHGREMDAAFAGAALGERYLIQLWPTHPAPPTVVKATSAYAAQRR